MLEKILRMIPKDQIEWNDWYVGRGRNNNVAFAHDGFFLTLCPKFNRWVIKLEGHFDDDYGFGKGCYQPFMLIDDVSHFRKGELSVLKKNKWYFGEGEYQNFAYWAGEQFLTIAKNNGGKHSIELLEIEKNFVPYSLIPEGENIEPLGKLAWDAHYSNKLKIVLS